ncbi:MAG: endonuclease domain-containing protein [Oscillospiraceae bacterium]|nr:endonuclease domain-containing protein [Oscillospiraceae bacterium]
MQDYKKHNPNLTPNARELRKNMTRQEKHLWYDFLRSYPVRILRQKVIDSFVVDFYCAEAKLVIEIDGSQHYTENGIAYDTERERAMRAMGLKTIRYTNDEIEKRFDAVCGDIDRQIKSKVASESLL